VRVLIYGTGAVGGYFGGRLAQAGHSVVFLARGPNLKAIQKDGLTIESPLGNCRIYPANAAATIADVGPVDAVVLGVKTWQVIEAAQTLCTVMQPHTRVLTLQNGVEAPYQVAGVLTESQVLAGVCKIIAMLAAPGCVRHIGMEPTITLGEIEKGKNSKESQAITEALRGAGITVQETQEPEVSLWQKLLFIAPFSGVGAISRSTVGEIRSCHETRQSLERVMRETWAVATAKGISLDEATLASTLAFIDSLPPGGTSSMQRDITAGRPSELEAIVGVIVRLATTLSLDVPITRCIYGALLPQEMRSRGVQFTTEMTVRSAS
jgi:2-dehydropantoate 2-reductase